MNITVNTFGTRGDVQPYIALALGLQAAGHKLRIATHAVFGDFVREHGLEVYPLDVDPRQVLLTQAVAELGNNTFRISRWMEEHFRPGLADLFRATLEAARDADLLVNSSLSFAGWHVAEKLGIPGIAAYLQPFTPTGDFPSTAAPIPPRWLPLKGLYNYASTKLSNQFFFRLLLPLTNVCREEVLDLPPLGMGYYWKIDAPSAPVPMLYGFSPAVIPRPKSWGTYQQIAGYWFLDLSQGYQPPPELLSFLDSGTKPVYIGFGSMVDHEREEMTRLVVEALAAAGQRGILLGGWSELGGVDLPDTILRVDYVPHDWLFPRVAAVVHHGGAGTTAAGLRAGVPSVIVPFFGDQPFWGWRVHELGAGPRWLPRQKLTAVSLAAAIRQAVGDETIRRRAADLGARIRAEDGVGQGVRWIEYFAQMASEWAPGND